MLFFRPKNEFLCTFRCIEETIKRCRIELLKNPKKFIHNEFLKQYVDDELEIDEKNVLPPTIANMEAETPETNQTNELLGSVPDHTIEPADPVETATVAELVVNPVVDDEDQVVIELSDSDIEELDGKNFFWGNFCF